MKQSIIYREMLVGDHQALRAMWETTPGLTIRNADSFEGFSFFLERNPGYSFTVESEDEIIGGILGGHDGRFGSIHHLVVMPEFQNQGIGKQLVKSCLDKIESSGIEKCHIFINKGNETGIKFWESLGWIERVELTMMSYTFELA